MERRKTPPYWRASPAAELLRTVLGNTTWSTLEVVAAGDLGSLLRVPDPEVPTCSPQAGRHKADWQLNQ